MSYKEAWRNAADLLEAMDWHFALSPVMTRDEYRAMFEAVYGTKIREIADKTAELRMGLQ